VAIQPTHWSGMASMIPTISRAIFATSAQEEQLVRPRQSQALGDPPPASPSFYLHMRKPEQKSITARVFFD
jgi:hypothetical protein